MAKHIENIVVGKPIVEEWQIFATDKKDWERIEKEKTLWTENRDLAGIIRDLGIVKSKSEIRRNKPQFCITLDKLDYMEITWGKNKLFILVGE